VAGAGAGGRRPAAGGRGPGTAAGDGQLAPSRAFDGHEVPALAGRSGPKLSVLGRAERATQAPDANREPLTHGQRSLPAFRVEVGAAQGAARRKRCDSLAALGAIAGVHGADDGARPSMAAKPSVSWF
jgi:hypothetical protein